MGAWTYRGYTGDSGGKVAPSIASLHRWLEFVDAVGESLGAYARRTIRGSTRRSVHETGRALDWRPSSSERGDELADILTRYPDGAGIQLVIWERRQWGGRRGPGWRPYTGSNPHTDHLHIESRRWFV